MLRVNFQKWKESRLDRADTLVKPKSIYTSIVETQSNTA